MMNLDRRRFRVWIMSALCVMLGLGSVSAWAENIDPDNDGSQYAWGENIGWLNAEPNGEGGPGVEVTDTDLTGYLWGENIGWINFDLLQPVQACKVCFDDLANFVDDWLTATGEPGDLNGDSDVDMTDYATLASYWLDYCPDAWPLK